MITSRFLMICSMVCATPVVYGSDSLRIGWMPTITVNSFEDPNGPVEDKTGATLIQAVGIFDMSRDGRLFVGTFYDSYEVDASTTNIHNSVKRFGISAAYQWNFRMTRSFKPWLGVGLGYSQDNFTDRYTVTPGGLLAAAYPDRSVDNLFVVLNATTEWRLSRDWDMGLHFQWEEPTGDGVRNARIGIYIAY